MIYDVIIIGAGPAGMSAGIYCCRKKLTTLILSPNVGGQMAKSWNIESYLGYHLISGVELAEKFRQHLSSFQCAELKLGEEVKTMSKAKNSFEIETRHGKNYQAKAIIIASGKSPRLLDVPGEQEFLGRGVTYCATCDAPLFKDKVVAVIGGGNSALDAAHQLNKIAKKVYLMVLSENFEQNIDQILLGNIKSSEKIEIIFNAQVTKIIGSNVVNSLEYQDAKTNKTEPMAISGVFIEIGSIPTTDFCKDLVDLNERGEIKVDQHNMSTMPGIFAGGDVTDVIEKQTIIAAGEGAKAAIAAANYLSRQKSG